MRFFGKLIKFIGNFVGVILSLLLGDQRGIPSVRSEKYAQQGNAP